MTPSFWIILFSVLIYGLIHSVLASLQIKAHARRWFGTHSDRWFRMIYNGCAGLTLLPILALPVLLVDREIYRIPYPWFIFTGVIQILSLFILLYGLKQTGILSFLGLSQLSKPSPASTPRLVTDGLYRYVRHPLYTAGLVFIWLFPIMTCNLLAIDIGLTIYILAGAMIEERKLLKEYGPAYGAYRKRTPMLIPFLRWPKPRQ
ncbi:MAG: isoprenylcysteine carboxylmethyltransferase family protein [Anaerolineales bacterium]|nr:isoprenylcysteine carboxylmethyltransferase family protein [Anaerolineales bacterium]